jgi:hypothetical protein
MHKIIVWISISTKHYLHSVTYSINTIPCATTPNATNQLINHPKINNKGGMSHCDLAIYIKKYLKAKEELWKFKYFTMERI